MTSRRRYSRLAPLPPIVRPKPSPPVPRRCGSGEYEVWFDGAVIANGFDDFAEANEWIEENTDV